MANYFVIDSTFNPYSFDELVKPYQMYGQTYREQEAMLDAAREKEFSPDSLDQVQDAIAYNMYNNASNSLRAASDELATRGLSSDLRSRIRTTARDYKTTMENLNSAQERLYAEQERRAKLGPDYVYQQNNLRIGDFLNGATPNQKSQSLTGVANDVAKEFAGRAKSITTDTWKKVLDDKGKIVGGYYDVESKTGLTAGQLDVILNTDDDTWNEILEDERISTDEKRNLQRFRDAISSKKSAIGFDDYGLDEQASLEYAMRLGATAGLETVSHEYKKDESYDPRLWFEQSKYRDSKALNNIQLQLKYPQYQFKDGKVVTNDDGSIKINDGWYEKNGKWYGPDGQIADGGETSDAKPPYLGVIHFNKNNEPRPFGSDKEANDSKAKVPRGTHVTRVDMLEPHNRQSLAIALGLTGSYTDAEVFNEAIRRGVLVSIVNHKNHPEQQEMILRDTRYQGAAGSGAALSGGGDGTFDENADGD